MSNEFDLKICCIGAGYVGGPTMAVIAANCPKVRHRWRAIAMRIKIFCLAVTVINVI
jgi:hypothetical protein